MSNACLLILLIVIVSPVTGCDDPISQEAGSLAPRWVMGGQYRLQARQFKSANISEKPVLVVVLHGDAPRHKPGYQYRFAEQVALSNDDVVAVALLRPGYTDPEGNQSEGDRGESTGDNWNAINTDAIASAITELKDQVNPRRVVIAGHSGGATIAANILWRHPLLIDAALLVSCPCNVNTWRQHMLERTDYSGFHGNIEVISPTNYIERLPDDVVVTMMVGSNDRMTPPELSEEYATLATTADKKVKLVRLPNKGHEIFLDAEVMAAIEEMLE